MWHARRVIASIDSSLETCFMTPQLPDNTKGWNLRHFFETIHILEEEKVIAQSRVYTIFNMKEEKQTNVLTFQITYKSHQSMWIQIPPQIKL